MGRELGKILGRRDRCEPFDRDLGSGESKPELSRRHLAASDLRAAHERLVRPENDDPHMLLVARRCLVGHELFQALSCTLAEFGCLGGHGNLTILTYGSRR